MGLVGDAQAAAERIQGAESVTLISHIDADGICSEAILSQGIARLGIGVTSLFVRQLEPMAMRRIPCGDGSLKVFTDLGAGQQNLLEEHGLDADEVLIIDHHVSQPCGIAYQQVNSLDHGFTRLSAAGVVYFVARELDTSNRDLAKLAVIGNVGDMMAREKRGLTGPAKEIAEEGEAYGNIRINRHDLNCYGTSTRPLHICLAYCDDPYLPGISNNTEGALRFLRKLDIPLKVKVKGGRGGRWLVWEEFDAASRRKVISTLVEHLVAHGEEPERILGETYLFPDEIERSPLRNASEFATLLNSCGRWAKPAVGSGVCQGDRGSAYREAEYMLKHHRSIIRELLQYILDTGVTEISSLQHIHVGARFPDTIVGIGAGMALSKLNWRKPIMIMSEVPEDPELTKVSMRTVERVVRTGIDLQKVLAEVSEEVGGAGGGHKIAAGAYIPRAAEKEFVDRVNRALEEQYAEQDSHHR